MKEKKLFGIYAHPVHHSMSPLMHNVAFEYKGLPYHYHAFDILSENLAQAVHAMKVLNIGGVNVSIPHKEAVIPLLDEVDDEALVIGAVNTIVLQENGRLKGYNTDGAGYVRSLLAETNNTLAEKRILILGAGGAAKGIAVYLLKNGCTHLTLTNRTERKATELALQLKAYAASNKLSVDIDSLNWSTTEQMIPHYQLLINTTPIGMWPKVEEAPLQLKELLPGTIVSDIVYNPLKTKFLQLAEEKGARIHQGLGMFIYQGALAFEYFTGETAPIEVMNNIVLHHLQQQEAN